jgi:FixJ family two-component response regulator
LLQAAGHDVRSYRSAEEFLHSGCLGDIHCLITDYGLPGMNGIEVLRAVHAVRAEVPVIVVTARDEPEILRRALAAGATEVFTKPIDTSALLKAIAGAK